MAQRRSAQSRRQQSVDFPRYPPQSAPQSAPQSLPAAPVQQLPQPSDYESGDQGYVSDYPSQPPPAARTNEELNLSVLTRYNSEITTILSIAPYAVIYEFSPIPEPTWSKTGVEGSLFICRLAPGPYGEDRYTSIVLNRRGMDNFEAELREADDGGVEITDEYVIISFREGHEQKIYGVFIFSEGPGTSTEHTREQNAELMKALAVDAASSRRKAEAVASAAVAQHTNGHVQEAEDLLEHDLGAAPMGRETSLQQFFGQQRSDDAAWSVRAHNLDGEAGYQQWPQPGFPGNNSMPIGNPKVPQQSDVLGDLFRRAGLGPK